MVEPIPLRVMRRDKARRRCASETGQPNLAAAIICAAEEIGEDGRGTGGLVGFFKQFARNHPKEFAKLLLQLLRHPMSMPDEPIEKESCETLEEAEEALRRRGFGEDVIERLKPVLRARLGDDAEHES